MYYTMSAACISRATSRLTPHASSHYELLYIPAVSWWRTYTADRTIGSLQGSLRKGSPIVNQPTIRLPLAYTCNRRYLVLEKSFSTWLIGHLLTPHLAKSPEYYQHAPTFVIGRKNQFDRLRSPPFNFGVIVTTKSKKGLQTIPCGPNYELFFVRIASKTRACRGYTANKPDLSDGITLVTHETISTC